ncbi:MAG: hypothetical protein ACE5F5_04990 [Acidimicrobiia bacterium]
MPKLTTTVSLQGMPIVVLEAELDIDGRCVTARTEEATTLLVGGPQAAISGNDLVITSPWGSVPERIVTSGAFYTFRGVPGSSLPQELPEDLPATCQYDTLLYLLGVLPPSIGELAKWPVDVVMATQTIGFGPTRITIDGACATIEHPTGTLLVVWPGGASSIITATSVLLSRWESGGEMVASSGDQIGLFGWAEEGQFAQAPPGCPHDGYFTTLMIHPPRR